MAAAIPDRIAAAESFHVGWLATDKPDSPHLLIPKTQAAYLIATAQNDDKQRPTEKEELRKLFADSKLKATVEVYPADHGWCVKGGPAYNEAQAERAWAELLKLYKANLA